MERLLVWFLARSEGSYIPADACGEHRALTYATRASIHLFTSSQHDDDKLDGLTSATTTSSHHTQSSAYLQRIPKRPAARPGMVAHT